MKKCLLLGFLLLIAGITYAQVTVTGTVSAASDGEAIPGVSIIIKGTTKGVTTDLEGNYTITADADNVLVYSFIGYKPQEMSIGNQSVINIQLEEDISNLEEFVVVGYGTMKKSDMSSAHVTVTSEDIEKTVNTTIEQAIQGRAAGVYVTKNTGAPGGGLSVNIRGINSIGGTNEPLYVIDGVQIQPNTVSYGPTSGTNPLAGLNPSDIESMEILQGPSATAIYGSRGTNGVVLITTKRGKEGQTNINYSYLYSLQDKPDNLAVMNLQQYAEMTNTIRDLTGGDPPAAFLDPSLLGEGTDWQDALYKTAALNKHTLSLSGGNESTKYYLSGEYFNQDGVAIGSGFERYSMRLNLDNEVRDWLNIGVNLALNETDEQLATGSSDVINYAIQMAPNIPVQNPDGSWGGADPLNGSSLQFTPPNPIALANLLDRTYKRRQALGGLNVGIDIMEGLRFTTQLNGNINYANGHFWTPTYTLGSVTNDVNELTSKAENSFYWNWSQTLTYNKTFADKHDLTLMFTHEAQESNWESIEGSRQNFTSNDLPVLGLGSSQGATNAGNKNQWAMESYLGRINYTYDDKYIVLAALRADGSANFGPENRWGYFPSVSAAWRVSEEDFMAGMAVVDELKIRLETGLTGNQGSANAIYAPLSSPSVPTPWGGGFLVTRYGNPELAWEETQTYNVGFNLNMFNNRVQVEGDFYMKRTDNLLLPNPLPWYMGTEGEGSIGTPTVNIGSLENRGYAFTINTVNIDNRATSFRWSSNFNFSGFKTEVTKFYSESAFIDRTAWYMNDFTQRAVIGQSPWLFYGYQYEGIFQSVEDIEGSAIPADNNGERLPIGEDDIWVGDIKYRDLNGDNIIDERDQTFIGNPWPKFTFGTTQTFEYKGFKLDILLLGALGADVFNYARFNNTNPNNINLGRNLLVESFDYAKVETDSEGNPYLTNPGTDIPRITVTDPNGNGTRISDKFVEDGSYVRLKNINLSYEFDKNLLGWQNVVRGARLSFGVQNLATWTKYKGYDPEVGAYVGNNVDAANQLIGVDYGRYPSTRMYNFSLGIDF
ncbi:SusC/RagA family TonB-linked outer membrane protein [Echinicola vietnamensis]|uniref:TonB-linked outer membrane protein, SusC/RagA family n=1 Tax=Echinicola vietnamensis (strain DSM 17526 / LMG 23754 / KMM 6221) TaxID=926556 RepID=L0G176_ECHVK|nr:TonB-dependent receptor [Echinicola vietnamensis]AGA79964.1 TonB-linked outer membrane protein, SusC/RagA family [Echinicola vietnamensis DSM 17526]